MRITELSIDQARAIAVNSQFNIQENKNLSKKIYNIFEQLRYIQIDTISVVNRAHHHALWTRSHDYSEEILHQLQATDRKIYEYWGHAMSYLPMKNFRFSLPRMEKMKNPKSMWGKMQVEKTKNIINEVKKRIIDEGPLGSKDFENKSDKKGGSWWDWKPAKSALELLYWQGELMITERKKFQKIYDLTERVLPDGIDTSLPSPDESANYIILSALQSCGIATEKEIMNFLQPGTSRDADLQLAGIKDIRKKLNELVETGEIEKIRIEGLSSDYYMLGKNESIVHKNNMIKFLSPFDNLIIQRDRTKLLFNFDYSLECYTPEPKRKYGYFVFPILFENNLVGRFDPKTDRKTKTLILRNLVLEPEFKITENFKNSLANELKQFTIFNNCKKIEIEKCPDQKLKKELNLKLKNIL